MNSVTKLKVRAITIHEVSLSLNHSLRDIKSIINRITSVKGDVLSLRLSLKASSVGASLLNILSKLVGVSELDYIAVWLESVLTPSEIVKLLRLSEKVYVSFMYSDDLPFSISELLSIVYKDLGWEGCSRLGLSIGGPVQTPYFPVTKPEERGYSISLLYPKFLMNLLDRGYSLDTALELIAEHALRFGEGLKKNLPFLGVDYSLSPWMDDSVVRLIEKINEAEFGAPGTVSAIVSINEIIQRIANRYCGIGFNEVMLSYAEDNRLKELARKGLLTLKDLINYTVYCVAGLDMAIIPIKLGVEYTDLIVSDLVKIQAIKRRCVGFRLVLVDSPPSSEVDLGEFGVTPVLRIR